MLSRIPKAEAEELKVSDDSGQNSMLNYNKVSLWKWALQGKASFKGGENGNWTYDIGVWQGD